jgi:hypothetical protein
METFCRGDILFVRRGRKRLGQGFRSGFGDAEMNSGSGSDGEKKKNPADLKVEGEDKLSFPRLALTHQKDSVPGNRTGGNEKKL